MSSSIFSGFSSAFRSTQISLLLGLLTLCICVCCTFRTRSLRCIFPLQRSVLWRNFYRRIQIQVACARSLAATMKYMLLRFDKISVPQTNTAATKFSCCSSNKKMSPSLSDLSISVALFLVEFRGPAAFFSFSLCFSCSIFQICGHDN